MRPNIDFARGLHFEPIAEPFICCCHFSGAFLSFLAEVCRMEWRGCFHPVYNWIIGAMFAFCSDNQKTGVINFFPASF